MLAFESILHELEDNEKLVPLLIKNAKQNFFNSQNMMWPINQPTHITFAKINPVLSTTC